MAMLPAMIASSTRIVEQDVGLWWQRRWFVMDAVNIVQISDGLWTSGQLSAEDIERLPAQGFRAVINLALPTSSNALPGEAERVTALGMSYVQIPVLWEQPTLAQLQQFFAILGALAGGKVWVPNSIWQEFIDSALKAECALPIRPRQADQ